MTFKVFDDKYYVWFKMKDEEGRVFEEEYFALTLTDFEILYGNISYDIIEIKLKKVE